MTQDRVNQTRSRALTPAEAVLTLRCPLCSAAPALPCGLNGSHLSRWLRAFALGLIARAELIEAVRDLVVISAWQIVERAA